MVVVVLIALKDLDPQQKLQFQLLIRILGNRNLEIILKSLVDSSVVIIPTASTEPGPSGFLSRVAPTLEPERDHGSYHMRVSKNQGP